MMAHVDSMSDHTQAKREAAIRPHRMADDLGGKAIVGIAQAKRHRRPARLPALFPFYELSSSRFAGAFSARIVYSLSDLRGLALQMVCGGSERRVAVAHC